MCVSVCVYMCVDGTPGALSSTFSACGRGVGGSALWDVPHFKVGESTSIEFHSQVPLGAASGVGQQEDKGVCACVFVSVCVDVCVCVCVCLCLCLCCWQECMLEPILPSIAINSHSVCSCLSHL